MDRAVRQPGEQPSAQRDEQRRVRELHEREARGPAALPAVFDRGPFSDADLSAPDPCRPSRRLRRCLKFDVDDLESLAPLALGVPGVGPLVGRGQPHTIGERREQRPGPQPPLGDDVDLGREHDDQREQVDPRDQAEDEAEHAVGLGRSLQRVADEVRAEDLHDLPADAGHDGADAQLARGHLARREDPERDHEEPDVDQRGERDRGDADPRGDGRRRRRPRPVASPESAVVMSTPAPRTSRSSRLRRRSASGFGRSLRGTAQARLNAFCVAPATPRQP